MNDSKMLEWLVQSNYRSVMSSHMHRFVFYDFSRTSWKYWKPNHELTIHVTVSTAVTHVWGKGKYLRNDSPDSTHVTSKSISLSSQQALCIWNTVVPLIHKYVWYKYYLQRDACNFKLSMCMLFFTHSATVSCYIYTSLTSRAL